MADSSSRTISALQRERVQMGGCRSLLTKSALPSLPDIDRLVSFISGASRKQPLKFLIARSLVQTCLKRINATVTESEREIGRMANLVYFETFVEETSIEAEGGSHSV